MASRLVGGSTCILSGRGESTRCRFAGRCVKGLEEVAVTGFPDVCADLPAVWLDAVFRSDVPDSPMGSMSWSSSFGVTPAKLGMGSSAMAKPSDARRFFILSFWLRRC